MSLLQCLSGKHTHTPGMAMCILWLVEEHHDTWEDLAFMCRWRSFRSVTLVNQITVKNYLLPCVAFSLRLPTVLCLGVEFREWVCLTARPAHDLCLRRATPRESKDHTSSTPRYQDRGHADVYDQDGARYAGISQSCSEHRIVRIHPRSLKSALLATVRSLPYHVDVLIVREIQYQELGGLLGCDRAVQTTRKVKERQEQVVRRVRTPSL